jgi:hypothetical protein
MIARDEFTIIPLPRLSNPALTVVLLAGRGRLPASDNQPAEAALITCSDSRNVLIVYYNPGWNGVVTARPGLKVVRELRFWGSQSNLIKNRD